MPTKLRWLAFLGFKMLPDTVSCRVAICFSGHARSFMHAHVRERTKERLVESLECKTVDVFFYLAIEESIRSATRREWDTFARPPAFTVEAVRTAMLEFNPIAIVLHQGEARIIPNGCSEDSAPSVAFSQHYKTAACFGLVEASERKKNERLPLARHSYYDWIVRARPDLAWVVPIVPIGYFRSDRVYLPGHFWPIGDMFALVPRHLANLFFRAIDTFYDCTTRCATSQSFFLTHAIG